MPVIDRLFHCPMPYAEVTRKRDGCPEFKGLIPEKAEHHGAWINPPV